LLRSGAARQADRLASEERLIPVIRAALAMRLADKGFRPSEIARTLKVTQQAVAQYLGGKRGKGGKEIPKLDSLVGPFAERLAERIRAGGAVEMAELLETASQVIVMNSGLAYEGHDTTEEPNGASLALLRGRLQLELDAAEEYLELANRTSDEYTKLLFRMIAADSIRHGDVVSQLISWLEKGGKLGGSIPDGAILERILALEDSANEASLTKEVPVDHPVARLLLRWIDIDESKHDKMVRGLISIREQGLKSLR